MADCGERRRLTVIVAAAGYGKTSLLAQWRKHLLDSAQRCAWLTLDGSESSATLLLNYVAASLRQAGVAEVAFDDEPMAAVIHAVENIDSHVSILIDDAHLLSQRAMAALDGLIERAPANCSFVVTSRATIPLHLARRRARCELSEMREPDLRFTGGEIREYLTHLGIAEWRSDQLAGLEELTEGWIAGVRLATEAEDRPVVGSNRYVTAFFAEEIFERLRPQLRDFLIKTAVCGRFCADVCYAVTGESESRALLHEIEDSGVFLVALDTERVWYRFHRLFAEFLQGRAPAQNALLSDWRKKASVWFWDAGFPIDALEQAQHAGSAASAAELLERRCQDENYIGKVRLVSKFAGGIPRDVLNRYPNLMLTLAWCLTRSMRLAEAAILIAAARKRIAELAGNGDTPSDDLRRLQFLLQHREVVFDNALCSAPTVLTRCKHLLDEYPEQHPFLRATVYVHLLLAQREHFDFGDFNRVVALAHGELRRVNYADAAVGLAAAMGWTLLAMGQTDKARQVLEHGRNETVHYFGPQSSAASASALALSEVLYENDELAAAERLIKEGLPSARESGFMEQLESGFTILARIHSARGDTAAARAVLDEGLEIAVQRGMERLRLALTQEKVRHLLDRGDLAQAVLVATGQGVSLRQAAPLPGISTLARDELAALLWVRLAQASNKVPAAIVVARRWRAYCFARNAVRSVIRWDILLALLHLRNANLRPAQRALRVALELGSAARMLRSFIDEGSLVQTLLAAAAGAGPASSHPADVFAAELLRKFTPGPLPGGDRRDDSLFDARRPHTPLGAKEREVLALMAAGLTNREIGNRLGMTEGTVKWYLQQVYDKVGTRRRQAALLRARQMGLISN